MSSNPSPQQELTRLNLADVLDRLAGALEQQARILAELKGDVGALVGSVNQIETRLASLEDRRPPDKPKGAAKKRSK